MKLLKTFKFTLVLKDTDENTPNLEDTLFAAGCDDALLNFRNGKAYLDFNREAPSLEQAITSAIMAIKFASLDVEQDHFA